MSAHPKKASPPYEPSAKLLAAQKAMDDAWTEYEAKRHAYRKAIADELRASGLSQGKMAEHTPYTEPTVRSIAIEYNVTPKRQVRSKKD
ncbi:hypothetical protein [Streptomyces sp. NPDC053560]|uniref:hypothetical protein n=1 Tax=Streptomyces sp. NPDC053560 TaxID=3365711 RepID=UPI0037CD1197